MEQTYGNYPQSQGLGHFGSYAGEASLIMMMIWI